MTEFIRVLPAGVGSSARPGAEEITLFQILWELCCKNLKQFT